VRRHKHWLQTSGAQGIHQLAGLLHSTRHQDSPILFHSLPFVIRVSRKCPAFPSFPNNYPFDAGGKLVYKVSYEVNDVDRMDGESGLQQSEVPLARPDISPLSQPSRNIWRSTKLAQGWLDNIRDVSYVRSRVYVHEG
jgi:hypothetical protein